MLSALRAIEVALINLMRRFIPISLPIISDPRGKKI